MAPPHFLVVTFPAQGHINPALQFAKRLLRVGAEVTFSTATAAHRKMEKTLPRLENLCFAPFSDGYDGGYDPAVDKPDEYMSKLKRVGSDTISGIISAAGDQNRHVTCVVYTILLPWVTEVARGFHVPSVLLWIQPATVLNIYYRYFNGYEGLIKSTIKDPSCSIKLPGLPLSFTSRDLPSFLVSSENDGAADPYSFILPAFREQIQILESETNPNVLVNTFDSLEPEALLGIQKFKLIAVGPILPSAYLDGTDSSDTSFGGDLLEIKNTDTDIDIFLNSKPDRSVIYISFGSISTLSKRQNEEIALALLGIGRPFLWVIRENVVKPHEPEVTSRMDDPELRRLGMIVAWCDQVRVVAHRAVGCFVTHCGWNSTMEAMAAGVPVVAWPQWTDQGTNAKLAADAWGKGVRVAVGGGGEAVERAEMRRCLEAVMGEGGEGEEVRRNARKWRELAREAGAEGGSADRNLRAFVDEIVGGSQNGW